MSDNKNTRETLLLKLKNQHNEAAWQEFNNIYKGFIWAILIKMHVPSADQDDLVQEILLKAWKSLPEFEYNRSKGKFRNWLSQVTSNAACSYFRQHNKKSKLFSDTQTDQGVEAEIDKITRDEWKSFISQMAWEKVSKTLSDSVRQCFELISKGEDLNDIATKMDLPYNTVCVYKRRIINKIAKEISDLEDEIG